MVDETAELLTVHSDVEYHGIHVREFCQQAEQAVDNPSEGICSMYDAFFDDIDKCSQGLQLDASNMSVSRALDSMLFLSCCVTSNIHQSSWVEMLVRKIFDSFPFLMLFVKYIFLCNQ